MEFVVPWTSFLQRIFRDAKFWSFGQVRTTMFGRGWGWKQQGLVHHPIFVHGTGSVMVLVGLNFAFFVFFGFQVLVGLSPYRGRGQLEGDSRVVRQI